MTRFVVDLGDIALSKEAKIAINADIQRVALTHIASQNIPRPVVMRFPPDLWGFIMRHDFEALLEGEKALGRGLLQTAGHM